MASSASISGYADILNAGFEWLPTGVLLVSEEGAIVLVNRALEKMTAYTRADLFGQSVDMLLPADQRRAHTTFRAGFMRQPIARPMADGREIYALRKDGSELPVEVRLTPLSIYGQTYVLASVVDLTERLRSEAALRHLLDDRVAFESLISDLAAQFVNLQPDDVDRTIEHALGRLVTALEIDRSALFQLVEDTGDFVYTHQWTRPGRTMPPPRVSAKQNFPWLLSKLLSGEIVAYASADDVPDDVDRRGLRALGTNAGVTIPLIVRGRTWGALTFGAVEPRAWPDDVVNRLRVIALLFANVLARKQTDEGLRRAMAGGAHQRARLRDENTYLRHELNTYAGAPAIVGNSPAARRVLEQVRQVAASDATVLLLGETGTGKSVLAHHIHDLSARRDRTLLRIHCAALSAASLERELLGRVDSSGRESRSGGLLDVADGSSVFFDEIADLPLDAQAMLVRVLQSREPASRSSGSPMIGDVRVIAATRRDLAAAVRDGSFRDDLYYRINILSIHVPPLRDRIDDLPLLVWRFVDEFSLAYGKAIDTIDHASMEQLQRHDWPGNASELRNVVERAMIVATGRRLQIPLPAATAPDGERETLAAIEKAHINAIVTACGGRIAGPTGAAARLGISARALEAKLRRFGLRKKRV